MLDGFNRIPPLVEQTKKLGMNACAITDHGNLYGAIEFYTECKKGGIKPIIGYEAYLAPTSRFDRDAKHELGFSTHLTLLAKNATGFKNLIKMSSAAYLEGFYKNPRIDRALLEEHKEGIVCLSGCLAGEFNQYIVREKVPEAEKLAKWFRKVFGEDFYIEIQNNGIALQDQCTPVAADIAQKLGIPLVATADAHYLCSEDARAHDVLFCINTRKMHDPKKRRYPEERMPNPYFVRSPEDMYRLFPGYQDAVARSQQIADGVDIEIDFKKRYFPVFTPPDAKTPSEYLRTLCEKGMFERYGENPSEAVKKRLDHELAVITKMGFETYFLVVWDFVRFARESGIPCTARGSGCGAIVSYVLYLSHVCPLEYDLLFERFLDPNRSEAPDIDIDFCQDRRELVIDYVKRTYGEQSVAQIGTFGTLAAKAALKDVGRVLDVPLDRVNFMCKLVPMKGAIAKSLQEALDESPDFRREYDQDPQIHEMVEIALKLEGTNRNVGTHAAGVVIANGPITNYVPVQRPPKKGGEDNPDASTTMTTQWEMGIIEKVGLLKMDFLGLRNLTVLDNCVRMIQRTRCEAIDPQKFPLDDADTYKLLQRGDAKGVFQLESEGIRELLKRMKPDNIRDLIAVLALYRPGPLEGGMVDEYVECKHGRRQPVYPHPVMEEVLSETYGVMVYQEAIMRILNRLGGIELAKAYACIKAISKKKTEIIEERKADFIKGAEERGLPREKAEEIFGLIEFFGGYGFNKSHTAAYAQIGYQTAYLKTHYTAEYMAALLSSEIDDGNKRDVFIDHIADARRLGIDVLPPDVNRGLADFDVQNNRIIFGLTAIKGLGRGAAEEIVRARGDAPFKDLFDFCERVDRRIVPKGAIEKMIQAGALDAFGRRSAQFAAVTKAYNAADERAAEKRRGQGSLFDEMDGGGGDDGATNHGLPDVPEWPETERLKFEKEALDFYISSHPLAQHDEQLRRFRTHDAGDLAKGKDGTKAQVGGMITNLDVRTANKGRNIGRKYAMFRVEDFTGSVRCIMWSDEYSQFKEVVSSDFVGLFEGELKWGDGRAEPDFNIKKVITLAEARSEFTKSVVLKVPYTEDEDVLRKLDAVGPILKRSRGCCEVYISVRDPNGKHARLKLNSEFFVNPAALKLEELEMVLGPGAVIFSRSRSGFAYQTPGSEIPRA
jgi:DNA polymerase-3 subunit alpha